MIHVVVLFPRYLQYLLTDFRQTLVTGASWDADDLITFLGQKVKVQGHTIAAEAHSTRRYSRVQLFSSLNNNIVYIFTCQTAFLTPSEECNRLKPCCLHIHSQINGTYSLCIRRICMIHNPSAQHIILQLSANPGLKLATLSPRIAVELIITVIRSLLDEIGFGIVPVAHRPSVHAGTPGSGFNKQSACVEPTHMSVAVHRCVQTTWTFT